MKPEREDAGDDLGKQLVAFMNEGRYREASELARRLLSANPQLIFLWKLYGVALLRQGGDALSALQRASQLLPDDAEVHYYLGTVHYERGDFGSALSCSHRGVELQPTYLAARLQAANALQALGRFQEAVDGYHRALDLNPALAETHNNLGNALRSLGQVHAAIASYRHALECNSGFADAHNNLGNALRDLGQLHEAIASYRRALEFRQEFAEAHNNLGNALRDLGQLHEAVASYRQALSINPGFADAYSNLGNALRDLGELQEALAHYRRALELKPNLAEAHNNLGNVLFDLVRPEEAASSYRQALTLKADYVHAHAALGMVLRQQGRIAAAEASCRRALEHAPESAETIAFLAEIHADNGQFTEAEALFGRAIAINPELPSAWAGIARYRKMTDSDASWLVAAQRILSKPLPLRQEINLRYALGKYFDDVKDYDQAFQCYQQANDLTQRYGARLDREGLTAQVDYIEKTYDQAWLNSVRSTREGSDRPLFVVGMPRSGTTLTEHILASHAAVFGAGELPFWNDAFGSSTAFGNETVSALAAAYLGQLRNISADALRVVDKMPTNFVNLGLIHAALPDARIIHTCRNPIDTCLSIFFQNFSVSHAYANDLEDLAHFYSEYWRVMNHWRATLPASRILNVPYEGLVSDPETWTRKMLEFAGLPWDPQCLEFQNTNRTVLTPSKWQVRQSINKGSSGRWHNYDKHVGPLRRLLILDR